MMRFKFALLLVLGIFSEGYGNDPEEYMTVVSLIVIDIIFPLIPSFPFMFDFPL